MRKQHPSKAIEGHICCTKKPRPDPYACVCRCRECSSSGIGGGGGKEQQQEAATLSALSGLLRLTQKMAAEAAEDEEVRAAAQGRVGGSVLAVLAGRRGN